MSIVKECEVGLPDVLPFDPDPAEPVAPSKREGSPLLSEEASSNDVLPVRTMHDDLPDVVTVPTGPPCCLAGRQSSYRALQIGPMPGGVIVRLVEQGEKEFERIQARDEGLRMKVKWRDPNATRWNS